MYSLRMVVIHNRTAATAFSTETFMASRSARSMRYDETQTHVMAHDMASVQKKQKMYERIGWWSYGSAWSASAEKAVNAKPVTSVACVL